MRCDKYFSELKILSRKECSIAVKQGRISVNGLMVKKADYKIDEIKDEVRFDGKIVVYKPFLYVMLNKPLGYVSSTDEPNNPTVIDLLPTELKKFGLFPCGRLDKETSGLIILTNDGESAHRALAPKTHVSKKYYFEAADGLSDDNAEKIEKGIMLADGYITKPCVIEKINDKCGYITLIEGKYHEIRRMFGAVHNRIDKLSRITFSKIELGNLPLGEWRYLTEEEEILFTDNKR